MIKFQILDTFVLTEGSSPRLAIGQGFYGECDVPRVCLNNLQLEYSWPLLSGDADGDAETIMAAVVRYSV